MANWETIVARARSFLTRIDGVIILLGFVMIVLLVLVGLLGSETRRAATLLVGLASSITGALLGLIFAVPRRLRAPEASALQAKAQSASPVAARAAGEYDANTSLEDICDWLTKIIVGVGLVEAGEIGTFLGRAGLAVGRGALDPRMGDVSAQVVGTAILVAFGVLGFLIYFLWFRQNLMIAWGNSHYRVSENTAG